VCTNNQCEIDILIENCVCVLGLDPAYPLFWISFLSRRIGKNDAKFVDIIHTNGGRLGMPDVLGHIDFFPNGGKQQPGCTLKDWRTCSILRQFTIIIIRVTT